MAGNGLIIRTQELGGQLGVLGVDIGRGIVVEDPSFQWDRWGSSGGSFTLKRDPHVQWPDLRAYAPVIVEERGGRRAWLGRIKQTPMTDGGLARQITVNCEGQQFHLDDDSYERTYVHSRLTDFVDARSFVQCPLVTFTTAGQVQVGDGAITLGWANGVPIGANNAVGATLDFGPSLCKRIVIAWQSSNNIADTFYCRGSDVPDGGSAPGEDVITFLNNSAPSGVASGTFVTPRRYLNFFFFNVGGLTPTADAWVKIIFLLAVGDTAYESSTASALKASDVVDDALDRATLLLSPDRSLITPTGFNIDELVMANPATPREVINLANAYHNYRTRVRADNRFEFGPLPALPTIEVGADSRFDEASAGDASGIYTRVIVTYTDPAGNPQRVVRNQTSDLASVSAIQPTNGLFETNTTGWAVSGGSASMVRDTVQHDTGIASLKLTIAAEEGQVATSSWAGGTFIPGRAYILTGAIRVDTAGMNPSVGLTDANGTIVGSAYYAPAINTWVPVSVPFTLQTNGSPRLAVTSVAGVAGAIWADSFILTEIAPTIIDRWNFKRTKILDANMSLTPAGAQQIADTFLLAHRTTPLKGKLVVVGNGRARRSPSGQGMTAAELGGETDSLVRMAHLIDPDTGKLGRIGRIAAVSWDPDSDTATIDIDSTSANFEALLARLAVVTGQVRN